MSKKNRKSQPPNRNSAPAQAPRSEPSNTQPYQASSGQGQSSSGGHRPPPPAPGGLPPWLMPMLVGGASVFVLFVGIPKLADTFSGKDKSSPTTSSSSSSGSSAGSSTSGAPGAQANLPRTPPPGGPGQNGAPPKGSPPPARGVLAQLPSGDMAEDFAGDAELAKEFVTMRDDLKTGKPPMPIRNSLETFLNKVGDNKGREHVLATLAYTELKTRGADKATTHLDQLIQEFPKSSYVELAQAMKLEAELGALVPKSKDAKADPQAMQALAAKSEATAKKLSSKDAKAYATYIQGNATEQAGDLDKAVNIYSSIANNYPNTQHAVMSLNRVGKSLAKSGRPEDALKAYEQLMREYPTDEATNEARKAARELQILGKPAPDLIVEDWPQGDKKNISELKGKTVLIVFWQTWCPHCREEIPHLNDLYTRYKDKGLVIIGATKNDNRQDEAKLTEFLQGTELLYDVARVSPRSSGDYAVSGIPAAALVDKNGIVRWRNHPGQLTDEKLEGFLNM